MTISQVTVQAIFLLYTADWCMYPAVKIYLQATIIDTPFSRWVVMVQREAKFHYASWFGASSELVRAEIWPIIQLASSELARASRFAAKFHYAACLVRSRFGACSELVQSWFEVGSKLVRSSQRNGIWLLPYKICRTIFRVCTQVITMAYAYMRDAASCNIMTHQ